MNAVRGQPAFSQDTDNRLLTGRAKILSTKRICKRAQLLGEWPREFPGMRPLNSMYEFGQARELGREERDRVWIRCRDWGNHAPDGLEALGKLSMKISGSPGKIIETQ